MSQRIGIIGAGPSGCALACFLAERGIECFLFDDNNKPSLLVGESLIPAAIELLRRLGVEERVAKISQIKLGAGLRHASGSPRVDFPFQKLGSGVPEYAYNIPRPQFDAILRDRAEELGVNIVMHKAEVETCEDSEKDLQLSEHSLSVAGLTRETQPDLLVDASGRSRLFSRTLNIHADRGPRNDVAHFAHFENFPSDSAFEGQIVITVLDCGWSWQIPLKECTSVGVVINSNSASLYGSSATERLANVIAQNKVLNKNGYKRITDVNTYSNYQLVSKRAHGKGWVLLGDALGFVDPMLSPGVFLTLECASLLDELIFKPEKLSDEQRAKQLDLYYQEMLDWHKSWRKLIEYFYDGRLLNLGEMHTQIHANDRKFSFGKIAEPVISNVISRLISGVGTRSRVNHAALFHTCKHLTNDSDVLQNYSISNEPKSEKRPILK